MQPFFVPLCYNRGVKICSGRAGIGHYSKLVSCGELRNESEESIVQIGPSSPITHGRGSVEHENIAGGLVQHVAERWGYGGCSVGGVVRMVGYYFNG